MTPEQIDREVLREIDVHGGRINIVELPALLNIDLPHIERRINIILEQNPSLILYNGDLISQCVT